MDRIVVDCANALQPDRCNQLADAREPRSHVGCQRVKLPVHGVVQGLNAPRHVEHLIASLL